MPIFSYVTKDYQGNYHRGDIDSPDAYSAASILRRKKLIIISIGSKDATGVKFLEKYLTKVPFGEVVIFTRQLATMIGAGLILSEALDGLQEQQTNKKFKEVLSDITNDVKGGISFAASLQKHPEVFPKLYSNLVKAGEASGKLEEILLQLAEYLEKEKEFKSKVRGAMIYPVLVLTMMFVVILIMLLFVMPRLTGLYKESDIDLPLPTKILLGMSYFMTHFWWLLLILIIVGVIMLKRALATPRGRLAFDRWILGLPIIGRIVNLVILTNFSQTFALLIAAGIPLLDAIRLVTEVVGNTAYTEALDQAYKGVERGLTFSDQLIAQNVFPKIIGQMVSTGEETGKLDEVLRRVSIYFESELEGVLKNITTLIEPVVLLILGIGVAFLVLSIILPIYKLTTSVQ